MCAWNVDLFYLEAEKKYMHNYSVTMDDGEYSLQQLGSGNKNLNMFQIGELILNNSIPLKIDLLWSTLLNKGTVCAFLNPRYFSFFLK